MADDKQKKEKKDSEAKPEDVKGKIHLRIMNPDRMIHEEYIDSLFVQGDTGEYELLPFHYPVFGLLRQGDLIMNWEKKLRVDKGVLRFNDNECVVLVELSVDKIKEKE